MDHLSSGVEEQSEKCGETLSLQKKKKCNKYPGVGTPIVPATWEAEVGGSPEPGRKKLHRAKIVPLQSSLATE